MASATGIIACDFRFGDWKIAKRLPFQIRKLRAIAKTEKHQEQNYLNEEEDNKKPSSNRNIGELVNIHIPTGPHGYSYKPELRKEDENQDQETIRYCEQLKQPHKPEN